MKKWKERAAALVLAVLLVPMLCVHGSGSSTAAAAVLADAAGESSAEQTDGENSALSGTGQAADSARSETNSLDVDSPNPALSDADSSGEDSSSDSQDRSDIAGTGQESAVTVTSPQMKTVQSADSGISLSVDGEQESGAEATEETVEADSTQGGSGTKKDVMDYVQLYAGSVRSCSYAKYNYGTYVTIIMPLTDGQGHTGYGICLDPRLNGSFMARNDAFYRVYRLDAPMLVKCLYYGDGGAGYNYAEEIFAQSHNGSTASEGVQILTHCALARIYEDLELNYKSGSSDWKYRTSELLQEDVEKYIAVLNTLPAPDDYYVYVASDGSSGHQDFAFLAIGIEMASLQIQKTSSRTALTNLNSLYSPAGAVYGVYSDEALTQETAELTTGADGSTEIVKYLPEGTYYIRELSAPFGYTLDEEVHAVTLKGGEVTTVELTEDPVYDPVQLRIQKKSADGSAVTGTLAGTQFTVRLYAGYYDSVEEIPEDTPHRTWILETREEAGDENSAAALLDETHLQKGSDALYKIDGKVVLPLGTLLIEETRAPAGYEKDAVFSDAAGQMSYGDFFLGQIVRDTEGVRLYADYTAVSAREEGDAAAADGTDGDDAENAAASELTGTEAVAEDGILVTDTPILQQEEEKPAPSISTAAYEKTSSQRIAEAGSEVTIVDRVTYKNLEVGTTYTLLGTIVRRDSGEAVRDADGEKVTAEKTFTCEQESGSEEMLFTFQVPQTLAGNDVVVFETLCTVGDGEESIPVAEHADLQDEAQIIHFPDGKTTAVGKKSGSHEEAAAETVTIVDTVSYENLVPGLTYTARGTLMLRETGKELLEDGEEVTAETTFVAEKSSGSCDVKFTFAAQDLGDQHLVVFEQLRHTSSGSIVFRHEDLTDGDQTVRIVPVTEEEEEEKASSAKDSKSAKTGDSHHVLLWVCLLGLGGIGCAWFLLKRMREKSGEIDH